MIKTIAIITCMSTAEPKMLMRPVKRIFARGELGGPNEIENKCNKSK